MSKYKRSLAGVKWNFAINNIVHGIQICQLILFARFLTPDDFAIIGIVAPLIGAFFLISELGFGAALIQKRTDRIEEYASSVLVVMLIMSVIIGSALIASADAIAKFYFLDELSYLLYFVAIVLVVKVYSSIITSLVIRNMDYKFESIGRLIGTVVSFLVVIFVLLNYRSYWAAVLSFLISPLVSTCFLLNKTEYTRIKIQFSSKRFSAIFNFSFTLLIANLVFFFSRSGMGLVLAKIYPGSIYGSYYFAQQTSNYPRTFFGGIINKVVMSGLSAIQDDSVNLRLRFLEIGRIVTFFTAPIIVLLIYNAGEVYDLFFGSKWIDSLYLFQCLMVFVFISTVASVPALALQAKGHANIILNANVIRVPLLVITLVSAVYLDLSISDFVLLFVCIEVVPALYCVFMALKILEVPAIVFCLNFLKSPLVIIFAVFCYDLISLNVGLDNFAASLLGPLLLYFLIYVVGLKNDLIEMLRLVVLIVKV